MRDHRSRPPLRLTCCLCSKLIAQRADTYPLDDEWVRRYPAMRGRIACNRCALGNHYWECELPGGGFAPGHIPVRGYRTDIDSWSHVGPPCTHVVAVLLDLDSAMIQGGAEYVRWAAQARTTRSSVRARLAAFLAAHEPETVGA
jgi:hypothetical protein